MIRLIAGWILIVAACVAVITGVYLLIRVLPNYFYRVMGNDGIGFSFSWVSTRSGARTSHSVSDGTMLAMGIGHIIVAIALFWAGLTLRANTADSGRMPESVSTPVQQERKGAEHQTGAYRR